MLHIFGWGTCPFVIFGSVSMSVEEIDALNQSTGVVVPCGRLMIHMWPVDRWDDAVS